MNTACPTEPYPPITFECLGKEDVKRIGTIIGRNLIPGSTVALYGQLGVGKTTMIQAICKGLGITEPVTSPTFTIVNTYQGRYPIYHVDLYRLREKGEIDDIGLEEMVVGDGICLFEWSEKAVDYLESPRLDVEIEWVSVTERNISVTFIDGDVWQGIYQAIKNLVRV